MARYGLPRAARGSVTRRQPPKRKDAKMKRKIIAKKKKPRIAPNGLESYELDHRGVFKLVNENGGLFRTMIEGRLHAFHIADPALAKLFAQAYAAGQKAQCILNESKPKGERLTLGVTIGGINI